jgi:DNA-binding IclR family transcriptional regulator
VDSAVNNADQGQWELAGQILSALAEAAEPVSAIRLAKRLGTGQSSLLRCLNLIGEPPFAAPDALGWVAQVHDGERLMLSLTPAGLAALEQLA